MRYLPFVLIFTLMVAGMEVDISLPCFPIMAKYFGTGEEAIQWTLTINFVGFCISTLLFGPLSDSLGRRKVMLGGGTIFLMGALGCVFADSISSLILFRFFQGLGASAFWTVGFAVVADIYQGNKAAQFIGTLNSCVTAAIAFAPSLGALLNALWGWRSTYTFIAVATMVGYVLLCVTLPETNKNPSPWSWKELCRNYVRLCKSSKFISYALFPNLLILSYFAFVGISPFLYMTALEVSVLEYTFHQGSILASFSITSFFSGRIAIRFGEKQCVITGTVTSFLSALGLCVASIFFPVASLIITILASFHGLGIALAFGPVFAKSLEIFPNMRGAASAFTASTRTWCCAVGVWLSGSLYSGTLAPVAIIMLVATGGCIIQLFRMYKNSLDCAEL